MLNTLISYACLYFVWKVWNTHAFSSAIDTQILSKNSTLFIIICCVSHIKRSCVIKQKEKSVHKWSYFVYTPCNPIAHNIYFLSCVGLAREKKTYLMNTSTFCYVLQVVMRLYPTVKPSICTRARNLHPHSAPENNGNQ